MEDLTNEFDSSARRFAEAATALEELKEQIRALTETSEAQQQAKEELQASNVALHAVVQTLSPIGGLGTELLASLQAAVSAAETIFDQTTIKAIRDDVQGLSKEVELLRDRTRAERDEARLKLEEMQSKVQTLPARTRNKHGLG